MKRVLGLDLGTASIGWAVVNQAENAQEKSEILGMGSRIIDYEESESSKFGQGQTVSKNAERTKNRTARKCYDRYVLRRTALTMFFKQHNMLPGEELIKLNKLALWELRAKAVSEQVSLHELSRILYHINQKRGYKSVKGDDADKKQKDYVAAILNRNKEIESKGVTVGQFLYKNLSEDFRFRCKGQIFPRIAYEKEFDQIIETQKKFYPEVLTEQNIKTLRDRIIFYHRDLKSCKHLVSTCELETRIVQRENGVQFEVAPKVAHITNPLVQLCNIWESINNLKITNKYNDELYITIEQKNKLYDHLCKKEKISVKEFISIVKVKSDDWNIEKSISALKGNKTLIEITKALSKLKKEEIANLTRFQISLTERVDTSTGEVLSVVAGKYLREPLYKLWHTLYSISDKVHLRNSLKSNFDIQNNDVLDKLCSIDFASKGYSKKSNKAICKILPYLLQGQNYYDAKISAGYNDVTLTKEENESRELLAKLPLLQKNSLRQPIVEKILNQMINLVNSLMDTYGGNFDEIRVELARELKQSKEERNNTAKAISANEKDNNRIAARLKEHNKIATKARIQKYKLWEETNGICVYCGKTITETEFLDGLDGEREHIIPKSLVFDDSFSNKVIAHSSCNKNKNNRTAYDYMASLSKLELEEYIARVDKLFRDKKISKTKRDNLLTTQEKIESKFLNRQLRQTQYISKKACEILNDVCYNVTTTTGAVTDFIRRIWGWNNVLHYLNFERFKKAGLVVSKEVEEKGNKKQVEYIDNWSKRIDHRHHAIDALVVACTKQGFIQRLNNLSSIDDVPFKSIEHQSRDQRDRYTKLEKYLISQPHFSFEEVKHEVNKILISFKNTRKLSTPGKRIVYRGGKRVVAQEGLLIPRGPLCEDSVYGKINVNGKDEIVIKYKLGVGNKLLFPKIKTTDKNFVHKIDRVIDDIIGKDVREVIKNHIIQHNYDLSQCFKETIYIGEGKNRRPIYSVRCKTGLEAVVPVRYEKDGSVNGYVKVGKIHHVAIYKDSEGAFYEMSTSFWHAFERKKHNIPPIIKNPNEVWDNIFNSEELSDDFLKQLPKPNSEFIVSLQRDDMFIMGMDDDEYSKALQEEDYAKISAHLYKIQNASLGNYRLCLHTLTQFELNKANKPDGRYLNIASIKAFTDTNFKKVDVDILGRIY